MKKYQQGDVLFLKREHNTKIKVQINERGERYIKEDSWSKSSQNDIEDNVVIALGEHTGHSHTFYNHDNPGIAINTYGRNSHITGLGEVPKFVEIKAQPKKFAVIKHEEHKALSLPPGLYETRIVREFDHLSQMTRNVVD